MKINLESSWDYYRKLNLIILFMVSIGINFGFTFFEKFNLKLFIILTFINLIFLFFLLLKKSIIIENKAITAFHSLFGIKIKNIKSLAFKNDSTIEFTKFKSRNFYQSDNQYDPTFHVEENIFEIKVDRNILTKLYNIESKEKFEQFIYLINKEK